MSKYWDVLQNINDQIRFADAKAGVILAFSGGSAAFLAGKIDLVHNIIVANRGAVSSWVLYVAFFGYGAFLVVTAYLAFKSILPALGKGDTRSLIYFKHICEDYGKDHSRYAKELAALSDEAMEAELAHQICANSDIATTKFDHITRAMRCLAWMGAFWAATIFMLFILGTVS